MWLSTPNEIIKNKLKLGVYKSKLIIYNSKCEVVKNLRTSRKQYIKADVVFPSIIVSCIVFSIS